MAFACQCDRCGKLMNPKDRIVMQAAIRKYSYLSNSAQCAIDAYDLCGNCCNALKEWLKAGQEDEKWLKE